jgi:ribonuclease HI
MFTDGSRLEDGATGYAVVWKNGSTWKGHRTHMGWGQEAYDTECAALARALQAAASRNHALGLVTIFTDCQAAISRMASDDPGPGQKYAIEARRHIAALRAKEPNVKIEIRWCPSHQGIEGNEVADKWAKHAADEPDAHGVEWFATRNPDGTVTQRHFPLPRSLANVKRESSEKKWQDAKRWTRKMLGRTGNRKYRPSDRQKPDPAVAKANKRLASRFYQFKTGHCLTGQYLAWTTRRPDATCWWCQYSIQTREHLFKNCPQWRCQQKTLWTTVLKETTKLPGPTRRRDRTNIAELLADERCGQAVLQFLATSDVGRTSGPPVAEDEEDAASEASEWEARDQEERAWERREEEEVLGRE